ncbi:MAG TPA: DUF5606 domain-containing protein [Puia sp.]|nr:DUF5606 domain-containing protein [Puia sp.]
MEYSKIIAVTGLPGLYELINSKNDGAIVRSLEDKGTRFVSSRIHNFSHLESIEVYTVRDNVNLVDILKAMDESGEKLPDEKDNDALQKYFQKVYKDLDFDRVYSSDLKKMVKWYAVLKKNNIEFKLSELAEEVEPAPKPEPVVKAKEEKKETKAVAKETPAEKKKVAPVEKKTAEKKAEEKKPVEKKVAKKKAEEPVKKVAAEKKTKKSAASSKSVPKKKSGK